MNTAQVTACQPGIYVKDISRLRQIHSKPRQIHSKPCVLPISTHTYSSISLSLRGKSSFGLKCWPMSKSREPLHICLAGGKGMMENSDENSPWKSLEKAMEKFKGQSIEDLLREQIDKGEYYKDGRGGAKPPGGGGGGSGDGPDGAGGSEDESFAGRLDENLQVIFGTLSLIFLYIYILAGRELSKLAKDYIMYLFSGNLSGRLENAMDEWKEWLEIMTDDEEGEDLCLEQAILDTPTWWHNPDYYEQVARSIGKSNSDEFISISDESFPNLDEPFSNSDESFF